MNILILGDGPEELAWAAWLLGNPAHRVAGTCPGFKGLAGLPEGNDLDAALATAGLDAVIVGGDPGLRAEGLRRASSAGLRSLTLHPPGPNADPYYQVAMGRQETGAIVVPDLPERLHPGVATLEKVLSEAPASGVSTVRYEVTVPRNEGGLLDRGLARSIDVMRLLIGEVRSLNASGIPSNADPSQSLTVQLRGSSGRHGEIRITSGDVEPSFLVVKTPIGSASLEHDRDFSGPSILRTTSVEGDEVEFPIAAWDPKSAILRVLEGAEPGADPSPGLTDATRAMEVAEGAARSLRRGRVIDLDYEELTELGSFKSIMTSVGCAMLLGVIVILFAAVAAQGLGFEQAAYVAWIIPPALLGFAMIQLLRFGIKSPASSPSPPKE